MIVYKITNKVTGKLYIGQTIMPLRRRWAVHKCAKRRSPLTSSIKHHGPAQFEITEICRATSLDELDRLEIFYIRQYNTVYPHGYNVSSGGGNSFRGCVPWNKGKATGVIPRSAFKPGQAPWNVDKTTSDETRQKQSLAKLGKHLSPDTEFKKGGVSRFKGRTHSEEALNKIRLNNAAARKIVCIQTEEQFQSVAEASRKLNISKSYLLRLVNSGKPHYTLGLTFRFL